MESNFRSIHLTMLSRELICWYEYVVGGSFCMRREGLELFEGGAAPGPRLLTGFGEAPVDHPQRKKGCWS